ncbi:MAG: nuclear transport factor 2 family protein [Chlorobiaceae bacterium]|nr:nuclear transport factor 2 family protein [Chlorobiaceae bacterium]
MGTRQLIDRYHRAWTAGDFTTARECLADNLDFRGSIDTFSTADAFIEALRGFRQMLRGVTLLQGYHDRQGAALLYDCDTASPAGILRTAEFFRVSNGKIESIRLVFDASELRKAK